MTDTQPPADFLPPIGCGACGKPLSMNGPYYLPCPCGSSATPPAVPAEIPLPKYDDREIGTYLASIDRAYVAIGADPLEPDSQDPAYIGEAVERAVAALRAQVARLEGELDVAQMRLKRYEPVNTYNGRTIYEWKEDAERLAAELAAMTKERDKYRWRESQALECVADYLDALDNDTEPASTSAMRLLFEPRELSGRDTAQAELAAMKADMEAAAGELRVSVSECGPGTLAGKLLSANVLLRHANSDLLSRAVDAEQVRDKIKGGAVTEEQVAVAEEAHDQSLTDQINKMGDIHLDKLDHRLAMRAALQAVAGMRGGG
jgi:hypothetical protein